MEDVVKVFETSCGARTIFWPGEDDCEATCEMPPHTGPTHFDPVLGGWDEDEMLTTYL